MTAEHPVIIVGAPRSGTSLMQKIIRETDGFVSVPRESDMIWLPHCHPSTNDWQFEGCPDSRITGDLIADIREDFASQALSARTWRTINRFRIMEKPRLAAFARVVYRLLFAPWKGVRKHSGRQEGASGRLVDKSVHAGLWLNLVDAVFPNAHYIHMVRSPSTCIPSMMQGWRESTRFRTYHVPESMIPPGSDTVRWWCFPMPRGWQQYYGGDLLDLCSFQWKAINDSILTSLSKPSFSDRVLRVHLEALTRDPARILQSVADLLQIDDSTLGTRYSSLPRVNASRYVNSLDEISLARVREAVASTYDKLRD